MSHHVLHQFRRKDVGAFNPDRMRVLLAAAAVRGRQTKVTVCMVRTVLQNRTKKQPEKPNVR